MLGFFFDKGLISANQSGLNQETPALLNFHQ